VQGTSFTLSRGTVQVYISEEEKHAKAVADIQTVDSAIDMYYLQNNQYPPTLEALLKKPTGEDLPNWSGPYIKKSVPDDPWGCPYSYNAPGSHNPNSYDLYSLGRDGVEGGEGADTDITNW